MTRIYDRPIAFIAATAMVSIMWFQTLTVPTIAAAPSATVAAVT